MSIDELKSKFYIPELTIDLYQKKYIHITVKESDNCRYVLFTITEVGNQKDMSTFSCKIKLLKPDGSAYYGDATITSDGRVLVHFNDTMVSVAGYAQMSLTFSDGENVISTLDNIHVDIESQPYPNSTIISSDVFDALNDQLDAVSNVLATESKSAEEAAKYATSSAQSANSAKEYYDRTVEISQSISGALKQRGTYTFEQVMALTDTQIGDMFNISNAFVSNSKFKDGSGLSYGKGTNIYYTSDKMWDVFVSSGGDFIVINASEPVHQNANTIWLKPRL